MTKKRTNQPSWHCFYHTTLHRNSQCLHRQGIQTQDVGFIPTKLPQLNQEPCSVFQHINVICKDTVFSSFTQLDGYPPAPPPRCRLYPFSWLSLHKQPASETASGFSLADSLRYGFFKELNRSLKKEKDQTGVRGLVCRVIRQRKGSQYRRNSLPEGQGSNYRGSCWDTESSSDWHTSVRKK